MGQAPAGREGLVGSQLGVADALGLRHHRRHRWRHGRRGGSRRHRSRPRPSRWCSCWPRPSPCSAPASRRGSAPPRPERGVAGCPAMPGPLQGVRVLDLSVMISGPLATMILADQGAEVIKVESPGLGDIMRFLGTSRGGMTGIFANNNRGKRSLVLDLKQPAGVDVLTRLVAGSDVFIQNFRPGAMDRLGLGYDALAAAQPPPRLRLDLWLRPDRAQQPPPRLRQRHPGRVGLRRRAGRHRDGCASLLRTLVCDKVTAWTTAQAITAALLARDAERPRASTSASTSRSPCWTPPLRSCGPTPPWTRPCWPRTLTARPTIAQNYAVVPLADGYCSGLRGHRRRVQGLVHRARPSRGRRDPRFAPWSTA